MSCARVISHASAIIAADFFTIQTVFLQTLYVIVVIELGTRRLLYANCTANPDSQWVTQQMVCAEQVA